MVQNVDNQSLERIENIIQQSLSKDERQEDYPPNEVFS